MNPQELKSILYLHRKWVLYEHEGKRANLSGADLSDAGLRGAYLNGAYLSGAKTDEIRDDFYEVLSHAKAEVTGLYQALLEGKIDGSHYEGECACLVGTIAKIKHVNYLEIEGLKPNTERLSEKWFLAIRQGDTPQKNPVSQITREWCEAWMTKEEIAIPKMKVNWE